MEKIFLLIAMMFVPNILLAQTPCEQRKEMLDRLGSQANKLASSICEDKVCSSEEMMELTKKIKHLEMERKDAISIYGSFTATLDPRIEKIATNYRASILWLGLYKQSESKKLLAEISGYDILTIKKTFNFKLFYILLFFLSLGAGTFMYQVKMDIENNNNTITSLATLVLLISLLTLVLGVLGL